MALVQRFVDAILAVAPLMTLSGVTLQDNQAVVDENTVTFVLDPKATPKQISDARDAVAAFDWSAAADRAYILAQLHTTFAEKLDGDAGQLFRALAYVVLDEINILRDALQLNPRTRDQVKTAIRNALQSGLADA